VCDDRMSVGWGYDVVCDECLLDGDMT